jgi:predicted nucleotidyltransferase
MPTLQDIDRRIAERLMAARAPLIEGLAEAARGKPWHYLLFGSMARGKPRRGSDVDIAVVGAGSDRAAAERAARSVCRGLGLPGDIMSWDDLDGFVQARAEAEGLRCGA